MSKKKYIDYKKQQQQLFKRTEGYAAAVRKIYQESLGSIIDIVKGTELEEGKPFSFSEYNYQDEVTPIFRSMYAQTYQVIRGGVEHEWLSAAEHNDELVKAVFGDASIEDHHFARLFLRNEEAMDAFLSRKKKGLDLSQQVWKYTGTYKEELEKTLDLAIGEGTPASRLAGKIEQYLNDPDRWYRRFRVKIGEEKIFDEEGNQIGTKPIYGRVWKRRIWDNNEKQYKWINDDPKDYHPGKGVYRSSYKNAQRLARTETNIAYRTSDYTRWQQLEFIVGIEIKTSNNHPLTDICDTLKGVYPKDFKWTGWHPNCRCYQVPILAPEASLDEMLEKIMNGEDPGSVEAPNAQKQPPQEFTDWVRNSKERIENATTLPYFIKDNQKLVDKVLYGLSKEEKKAMSYSDLLVDPLEILKKYGEDGLDKLYSAVQSKLGQMLKGDLQTQKSTLEFEINYVESQKKYATWREAAEAYKKALAKVNAQIDKEKVESLAHGISQFVTDHPHSKKVKALWKQIQDALDAGDLSQAKNLIAEADKAVLEYNAKKAKQAMKSTSDIEKYCDAHRTFDSPVVDQPSFEKFQERMLKDSTTAWNAGTEEARQEIVGYTNGSYDWINASYWRDKKGCDEGTRIGSIIDNCILSEDTVLRRGCNKPELGSIFGDEFGKLLRDGDIDGLNALKGTKGVNEGFISTSFDMEGGFWKSVDLRIYAPKGTQALYAKPISVFGDSMGKGWDGTGHSNYFSQGRENEVIVNKGYEYRFIKAEKSGSHGSEVTIYIELLSREKRVVK